MFLPPLSIAYQHLPLYCLFTQHHEILLHPSRSWLDLMSLDATIPAIFVMSAVSVTSLFSCLPSAQLCSLLSMSLPWAAWTQENHQG